MVSKEEIIEINKKLKELEKRISKLEVSFEAKPDISKKEISIKEFIISKNPKDDVQRTLAIGFYFENYKNFHSFNANELKKGYREAREKVPINVSDKIQLNIRKGHIMDVEDKKENAKAWTLTDSGEKYVKNNFKNEK